MKDRTLCPLLRTAGVMGAHWRLAVSHLSDRHSELAADKTAAEGARLKQEQRLHDLEVEHEKHVGIYAPKASLKAMGLNQDRAPRRSAATEAGGKKSRGGVEDAPERYPAVSYFSRLRELSRRVADVARPSTSRPRHLARGMLYQRNVGLGANNARQEEYVGDVSPLDWKNKESEGERVGSEPSRVEGAQKRLHALLLATRLI